jgi:hypothetical protein
VKMLHEMLRLPIRSSQDYQDIMATATATVLACRPSDAVNIEVCDFMLEYQLDPKGTAAVRLWGMKNDKWRKGHHPRIGKANDQRKDLVTWILKWCARYSLKPHPDCSKLDHPRASCKACGTLFRKLIDDKPLPTRDPQHALTTGMFTAAVRRVMTRLGHNPTPFQGRSCRSGGLSAGANVCLPDYLITLQTGHARGNKSAPGYMTITDPKALFALWKCFRF